ncbi:hypothetical protein AB0Y20_00790 [Heyndrickxia oleronia]|uniref:hypothetical protein n=1 Tax=Heyndrickxia oleronia TaxID=38875 RepID=UPI003F1FA454
MKTFKLEIQNTKGEIITEENVILSDGDKLIVSVPDNVTMESINRIFENVKMMMEHDELNTDIQLSR